MLKCPVCSDEFERLSKHWALGSCGYPAISDRKKEIFKGLLMGDGCIADGGTTPNFVVAMANQEFINWLSDEMGWLLYPPFQSQTAKQSAQNSPPHSSGDPKNFSAIYRTNAPSHPWFSTLRDWYDSGQKRFPDDLTLTPLMAKMWYVSDGGLRKPSGENKSCSAFITSRNEMDRPKFLESLFESSPVSPTYRDDSLRFTVSDTKRFLEWIGEPVPGFERKWEQIDEGGFTPWRDKQTLEYLYIERDLAAERAGEVLGCSADTVLKWVRNHGLPVRSRAGVFE